MIKKLKHRIILWLISSMYKSDEEQVSFLVGTLGEAVEASMFGRGDILECINIEPDEDEGYIFEAFARGELEYDYDI